MVQDHIMVLKPQVVHQDMVPIVRIQKKQDLIFIQEKQQKVAGLDHRLDHHQGEVHQVQEAGEAVNNFGLW